MKTSRRTSASGFHYLLSKLDRRDGFSMSEALVSSVFVALSTIAVISAVGAGVKLQVTDDDRRQARALIKSVFEEQYDFWNYNSIVSDTTLTETVVIGDRTGNPLPGELTKTVRDVTVSANDGYMIPALQVTLTCKWNTDSLTLDSIKLTKLLAQARR